MEQRRDTGALKSDKIVIKWAKSLCAWLRPVADALEQSSLVYITGLLRQCCV